MPYELAGSRRHEAMTVTTKSREATSRAGIVGYRTVAAAGFAVVAAVASFVNPSPARAQVPGLVAAYAFNEGSGTTVADVSGNNNNGTISAATWTTAGKFGSALVFNGTSAQVTVPNATSLQLTTGMTLEVWVFPTGSLAGWRAVLDKNVDGYYLMASSDPNNRPAVGGTWTGGNQNTAAPSALALNVWTHLAASFDGATVRLYVNGVQVASQAQTTPFAATTGTLQIGADSYGEFFAGRIDEVRIYNRALSAAEIQTDMNTAVGGTPPPPDTIPPSAPAGLGATAASSSQINLSWSASTDNVGVTGYRIYRSGSQVGTSTSTSYQDTGLSASTSYSYTVAATDAAGNVSAQSSSASATTQANQSSGGGSGGSSSIPSALGWYQIPNSKLSSNCPTNSDIQGSTGCAAVLTAWGSALPDTKRN